MHFLKCDYFVYRVPETSNCHIIKHDVSDSHECDIYSFNENDRPGARLINTETLDNVLGSDLQISRNYVIMIAGYHNSRSGFDHQIIKVNNMVTGNVLGFGGTARGNGAIEIMEVRRVGLNDVKEAALVT